MQGQEKQIKQIVCVCEYFFPRRADYPCWEEGWRFIVSGTCCALSKYWQRVPTSADETVTSAVIFPLSHTLTHAHLYNDLKSSWCVLQTYEKYFLFAFKKKTNKQT